MGRMKKKLGYESSLGVDLKSMIHEHSIFFDKLVELIPAKFYLPTDDKDKPWFQGLSKCAKASAKKESKQNIKKARRDRLDPEKSSTTTLDLLMQSLEKEKSKNENESGGDRIKLKPRMSGLECNNQSVTYEELRQRLHRKIEELRGNRNSDQTKMNERSEKKGIQQNKGKRGYGSEEKNPPTSKPDFKVEKDVAQAAKELSFSHVKLGNEEEHVKKKRKLSKFEELEKAKKLVDAKKDPEKGEFIAQKHSWNAAANRAAGIKVHDDPKLLKQRIQKEKKRHEKNAEKWKERLETRDKMKAEKQQTRSGNVADRINQKKQRRIAKREKKLMRPGFEGRKEGFINESSA